MKAFESKLPIEQAKAEASKAKVIRDIEEPELTEKILISDVETEINAGLGYTLTSKNLDRFETNSKVAPRIRRKAF